MGILKMICILGRGFICGRRLSIFLGGFREGGRFGGGLRGRLSIKGSSRIIRGMGRVLVGILLARSTQASGRMARDMAKAS